MARLKEMIKNLDSPIFNQESALKRQYSITFLLCYVYFMIEIFLCFSLFPFFASCFALRQNAFTIPWDFLFYILCNLGKFKRNYEYNLSLIYKVPI